MNKYKNLIVLWGCFWNTIHLIFTGAITPKISKWLLGQAFENNSSSDQLSYMVAILRYARCENLASGVNLDLQRFKKNHVWSMALGNTNAGSSLSSFDYVFADSSHNGKEKAELTTPNNGVDSDAANPAAQVTP